MLKRLLGPVAGDVDQDGAELQRGVVGNAKAPIGREVSYDGIREVPLDDLEQVLNFLRAGLMDFQSSRYWPIAASSCSVPFTKSIGAASTEVTK